MIVQQVQGGAVHIRASKKNRPLLAVAITASVLALALMGCSDGGDDAGPAAARGQAGDPEAAQEAPDGDQGGGRATLAVGGETYEFDRVLCSFGPGDNFATENWDFVLTTVQDGLRLRVARGVEGGQFGDEISLEDEAADPPSVSWRAGVPVRPSAENPTATGEVTPFVEVNGQEVSAEADFADFGGTAAGETRVPGTLTATCP